MMHIIVGWNIDHNPVWRAVMGLAIRRYILRKCGVMIWISCLMVLFIGWYDGLSWVKRFKLLFWYGILNFMAFDGGNLFLEVTR